MGLSAGVCAKSESAVASIPTWGVAPAEFSSLMLPQSAQPQGVLELYLMGGLNPWDTFYAVEDFGKDDKTMLHTFMEGERSVPEYFNTCGGAERPLTQPFGKDAADNDVNLGPWIYPLRDRQDILDRMRIIVMQHQFEPHGVASPLALTGQPRGTPRMAATGAHVERFFRQLEPDRVTPHAYVLYSLDSEIAAQFDIHTASATGLHSAQFAPLAVRMVPNNPLPGQLARDHLGGFADSMDAAMQHYIGAYRQALKPPELDAFLKARAFDEIAAVRHALRNSPALLDVLTPDLLKAVHGEECGVKTAEVGAYDTTAMGLTLATNLLTRQTDRAKHVTVIDSGLINASGAGYDTHDDHVVESSRNVVHMSRLLAERINKPGESDPEKLDLDKHTILLTTEFGRTPYVETGKKFGLDHWPFGYVVIAIGGTIGAEQAGIAGAIRANGRADGDHHFFNPAEFRAAVLMSMGIWPFNNEAFAVGDVRTGENRAQLAARLRVNLLGHES